MNICKVCNKQFEVTKEDEKFLEKISPSFDEEIFLIPPPTLCPDCRNKRRLGVRNVVNLYKRKCDLCSKEVVSMYSPDKTDIKVYCSSCWWSDKWDYSDYAKDYDPSRSFIEQLTELKKEVPAPALLHVNSENSEYINFSNDNKNCYLVFLAGRNEDVYYGYWAEDSRNCVDTSFSAYCEMCYEGVLLGNCYNVHWSINCGTCRDSYFIEDCADCSDCILCSGLLKKQYCYKNKQLSREEYEKVKTDFLANLETNLDDYKQKFRQVVLSQPKKYSQMLRSEDCSGDNIFDSKGCNNCFRVSKSEDCKYCYDLVSGKDSYDVTGFGIPIELVYESQNIGLGSARCAFISFAYQLSDSYYCEHCYYSRNLFGCVGAKNHAEFCILNKKYSKEEYDKLVQKIIADMQKRGEWGEFFPSSFSAFGYNETLANEYYPLAREEAEKLGYKWQEVTGDVQYDGEAYNPVSIERYKTDEQERNKLLGSVLKCIKSGRPFKIMPQELLFYIRHNIPIPRVHYAVRMTDRLNSINKNELFHRQCMCEEVNHNHEGRCAKEFETSYSPNSQEKVYCEDCYWEKYR